MFLKFSINFSIYTKGGYLKKVETVGCFVFDFNSLLKFLCISEAMLQRPRQAVKIALRVQTWRLELSYSSRIIDNSFTLYTVTYNYRLYPQYRILLCEVCQSR